ncbi:Hypothetical protein ORPV_228 [Orpheovirus IHUMI-LCC2]|uniref:Uncharacterized protein n=1 Tax=Orpheovirus IHUMI-LCC2 TaxID=2023057 RepID=A0A2I2L3L6_9VIRU|nr:Hypothetical protein ORPV_228 [Orpheovirus IHUMI-LCC2]SNW62132.1 Hypothetical protein ORPV_228 [Orpheovirus IHUMI-LCC2]
MELPESLLSLNPINSIINNNANMVCNIDDAYHMISEALVPILIAVLRENNFNEYCFSQTIYLNARDNGDIELKESTDNIKLLCDNNTNRFILYFIDVTIESRRVRHSNALLIDSLYGTIEYFEPNGSVFDIYSNISTYLQNVFLGILPEYKFLSTSDFCPRIGVQAKSQLAICGAFSLLFLLMRVLNEDVTSGELLGILIDLSNAQLKDLMLKFICYINLISNRYNTIRLEEYYETFQTLKKFIDFDPELNQLVENLYHDLDLNGLYAIFEDYNLL